MNNTTQSALEIFAEKLAMRLNEYKNRMGLSYFDKFITITEIGSRYARVYSVEVNKVGKELTKSIIAFVDVKSGDVLKPATYKVPAKHARGNINSPENGMEAIDDCGFVKYLR